jgi:hypothetical protein
LHVITVRYDVSKRSNVSNLTIILPEASNFRLRQFYTLK